MAITAPPKATRNTMYDKPTNLSKLDGTAGGNNREDPSQTLLERVQKDYNGFFKYIEPYRTKWENYWKLWNNERIKRQYQGDNDSFEPMTFQMVETIVDNVYGSRPKLTFLPTRKDQETDTKILNGLWDASWDTAGIDDLLPVWGREITITGNGCWFPCMEDGLMKVKHFPIRDCILDIRAKRPEQMRFAGYRRLALLEDLKKEKRFDSQAGEIDPETGEPRGAWVPRYSNLSDIPGTGGNAGDQLDSELKDKVYAGSTLTGDEQQQQVEVLYMHYLDKVVEVANRSKIIYQGKNYYQKDAYEVQVQQRDEFGELMYDESSVPAEAAYMMEDEVAAATLPVMTTVKVPAINPFIPVILQREFVDPALLIAKGDVEPFADTQEELNDSVNVKKDNVVYNVQNVGIIDSLAKEAIADFAQAGPGSIIPIKGLADSERVFKWLEKPDMSMAADAEINRAKKVIRDTARVGEVVQGIDNKAGGDETATEINAQLAQATSGFSTKIKGLETGAFKQLGEMFVKMVQIFLTEEQLIRVVGRDGVEFKQFDPTKYWGPYDVKVVLEQTAEAHKKEEADRMTEVYATLLNDPAFNQLELKKMYLRKALNMDDDDIELLLNPNPMNMALGPDGQPVGDATAGSPTATEAATSPYSGAPPEQPAPPTPMPLTPPKRPRIHSAKPVAV